MTDIVANRRAFLKGLAVAPVAAVVPAAVAPAYAKGGRVKRGPIGLVGEIGPEVTGLPSCVVTVAGHPDPELMDRMRKVAEHEMRRAFVSVDAARLSVGFQPTVLA